jgi:hypothetical protein
VNGRGDEAMKISEGIVPLVDATGIPSSISGALLAKGKAFAAADPSVALAAYERAVAIAHQSGNRLWEILAIFEVGTLQARSGDPIAALRSFQQIQGVWRRSIDLIFVSHGLSSLIVLFDRLGRTVAAATLNGTLTKNFEFNPFVPDLPAAVAHLRDSLGDARFDEANRRGAAMALHEANDYAVDQVRQALAALGVSDAEAQH